MASGSESTTLVVIDLASSRFAQPMVRRAARRAIASALRRAARAHGARPRVLVHGDDPAFAHRDGVELLNTLDYAFSPVSSPDEPWVDAVAREVLYGTGSGFFGSFRGVSLADLCRLEVQDYFLEYVQLAGAISRVLSEKPVSRCRIITSDPERAAALESAVSDLIVDVKSWAPPFVRSLRDVARRLHKSAAKGQQAAALSPLTVPRARLERDQGSSVLYISESAPQAQMFSIVEAHLAKHGDHRSVRVQFVGDNRELSVRTEGKAQLVTVQNPSGAPPASAGRFRARWRAVASDARGITIEKPYAGASGVRTLRAPVAPLLEHLFAERFDQLVEHIEFAQNVIDLLRPQIVVLGNDRWWVGQAFVRAAQQRGIPTLLIQDGLTGDKATWWWISADHVAAFSPAFVELLAAHGVSRDRVTITGQPRYDSLSERRRTRGRESVLAARRALGLETTTNCILLATQPHQQPERVKVAVEALLEIAHIHVLLRPHPNEGADKYRACANMNPSRVRLCSDVDVATLLDASDLVVTEFSTVALEGAILGLPVIIATLLGDRCAPEVFGGFSVTADSEHALRDHVLRLTSANDNGLANLTMDTERLDALVGPLDGRSGARVASLIDSLSNRSAQASVTASSLNRARA